MTLIQPPESLLEPVTRLSRDLARAAGKLGRDEARFLVDAYYSMQKARKAAASQVAALSETEEPHDVLLWLRTQNATLEAQVKRALDSYSAAQPLGQWARSIVGIGPVIAAGLLAHVDLEKAPTAGSLWRFAGLDPSIVWGKGQRRPYNARLKVLCFHVGECFIKTKSSEASFYGPLYDQRRAYEDERNESGGNKEAAQRELDKLGAGAKNAAIRKILETGKLRRAHLRDRARRWVVKLFLSHYHEVGRTMAGLDVPQTYPLAQLEGHAHKIEPPNWPPETPRR